MALIHIKSIPRDTATKLSEFKSDTSGKSLGKTKMGKATDRLSALWDDKVGGLANGLSYKPWIDEAGNRVLSQDGTPLTLQHKMEQKWNLAPGYLTNRMWKNGDPISEKEATYYQSKYWILVDGTTILDTSKMHDELGYYMLLDSKYVAASEKDWKEHKKPNAKWYIALENEADELKASKLRRKTQALGALADVNLPLNYQIKFVHILNLSNSQTALTQDAVFNLLYTFIESSDHMPNSNIDRFMKLYEDTKTPHGKEEIEARHLLKRALDSRVVYEKQGTYNWVRPEGLLRLGENYAEAIQYLLDPKKEVMLDELEREIKLKGF